MLRALHLIDENADFQCRTAADQLARGMGAGFAIDARRVAASLGAIAPLVVRLRRAIATLNHDLTHAFGPRALAAAVMSGGRILYTPAGSPTRREIGWLRAICAYREVHIACPTDTMRRRLVEAGIPIGRCHLIRPGVDFAKVKRRRDDRLRAQLGFAEDDFVVLAPGESDRAAAHWLAAWAVAILYVLDPTWKLLVWGRGPARRQAAEFASRIGLGQFAAFAESRLNRSVPFEQLLSAADAVLVTARGPVPTLPISICMAAGLPIVATVSPTLAELLEDRHTALLAGNAAPRAIAQRLMDLRAAPGLQWRLADMARTEAYEYASQTRFLNQFRALYQQVAQGATEIDLPQPAPGAGLRFHGRA